jgi:hypothetical protein
MRVAIYAQVSSKGGRQEAENQLRQLRAFAVSQSWTMVHEYVDRLSGKTADREQFQLMFQAASVSAMRLANPLAVTLLLSAFPQMEVAAQAILLQADEILFI